MFSFMKNTYEQVERELGDDLMKLLSKQTPPPADSPDFEYYQQVQLKIASLKQKMAERHQSLMEDLDTQETFSRKLNKSSWAEKLL